MVNLLTASISASAGGVSTDGVELDGSGWSVCIALSSMVVISTGSGSGSAMGEALGEASGAGEGAGEGAAAAFLDFFPFFERAAGIKIECGGC
jgi:hypothetical protein